MHKVLKVLNLFFEKSERTKLDLKQPFSFWIFCFILVITLITLIVDLIKGSISTFSLPLMSLLVTFKGWELIKKEVRDLKLLGYIFFIGGSLMFLYSLFFLIW